MNIYWDRQNKDTAFLTLKTKQGQIFDLGNVMPCGNQWVSLTIVESQMHQTREEAENYVMLIALEQFKKITDNLQNLFWRSPL
jgi:hypothetical protein